MTDNIKQKPKKQLIFVLEYRDELDIIEPCHNVHFP